MPLLWRVPASAPVDYREKSSVTSSDRTIGSSRGHSILSVLPEYVSAVVRRISDACGFDPSIDCRDRTSVLGAPL